MDESYLDTETRILLTAKAWAELNPEEKKETVFLTNLALAAGVADLPVAFEVMELAEAEGMRVFDWRRVRDTLDRPGQTR